jgi:hypothetical protein
MAEVLWYDLIDFYPGTAALALRVVEPQSGVDRSFGSRCNAACL